ncbi:hypothetical protein KY290_017392 [Solanum tuberosum]|uniref:CCHC-type domain-containing protein n=1 Tax=Solanum tuberosum TaxID=4113 RepID=A0ABQ7VCN7_SOLTU|nr:hypothetical protein KY290_017392 [Solanum tuberosum]
MYLIEDLHDKLRDFESYLAKSKSMGSDVSIATVNATTKSRQPQHRNRGSYSNHNQPAMSHTNLGQHGGNQRSHKPRVICQLCENTGHIAKKCYRAKEIILGTPTANNTIVFIPTTQGWLMDSGASHHVTNDIQNLYLSSDYDDPDEVQISDGSGLHITHDLNTREVVLQGQNKDNVYVLPTSSPPTVHNTIRAPIADWHRRLGYPSDRILHHIIHTDSLPLSSSSLKSKSCVSYACNKSHRLPFSQSTLRSLSP